MCILALDRSVFRYAVLLQTFDLTLSLPSAVKSVWNGFEAIIRNRGIELELVADLFQRLYCPLAT
jgi:hypothetical protein